jgi:diguanylate cyclase (GGDEF)-like protein
VRLADAGHPEHATRLDGLYVAAYFTAAGASSTRRSSGWALCRRTAEQGFGRLILTTSSLIIIPIIALAATGPADRVDGLVRSASALVLAGAVTLRVTQAVRANGRTQDNLRLSAQTDALTHLPNRTLLLERINQCLRMAWQSDSHPTLYFVDLDRFKNINDSLGHAAGDEVLKMVAIRLSKAAPEHSTVARLSGDEYVVLDPSTRSPGSSLALAERLLSTFREPLPISQGRCVRHRQHRRCIAQSQFQLLGRTSCAMPTPDGRAKDAGAQLPAVYDESMHERVAHRLSVETRCTAPSIDASSACFPSRSSISSPAMSSGSRPSCCVAAGRRHHGVARRVHSHPKTPAPSCHRFVGSARGADQLRNWIDDGVCSESATMSVNVARQLSDPNFRRSSTKRSPARASRRSCCGWRSRA